MGKVGLREGCKSAQIKALDIMKESHQEKARIDNNSLSTEKNQSDSRIWSSLTDEQKREVYLSFFESEDDNNLVDWDEVKKTH